MVNENALKQGMYVLGKTVKNPKVDRRKNDWISAPEFKAGMRLYYRVPRGETLSPRLNVIGKGDSLYAHDERFLVIAPHLVADKLTDAEWLKNERIWPAEVLVRLIRGGKISREAIAAFQKSLEDEWTPRTMRE